MAAKTTSTKAKGALATDPSFKLASGLDALRAQRSKINKTISRGGGAAAAQKQAQQVRQAILSAKKQGQGQTPPVQQGPSGYDQVIDNSNEAQNGLFQQIEENGQFNPFQGNNFGMGQVQQIGTFNPGDFQQQYQQQYDNVMNQFNRTMQPQFQRQQKDFDQYAAERGLDPNSDAAKELYKNRVSDPQSNAMQGAMESAHGAGLQAQGQAYGQSANTFGQNLAGQGQQFNQAYSTYQMPYQNLAAFSPYFGAQASMNLQNNQQGFVGGQNALDRQQQEHLAQQQFEYNKYLQAHQPHGGGGGGGALSFDQQIALQNNAAAHQMVYGSMMAGAGGNNSNPYNSAISGFAQGFGAGAGQALLK